MYRKFTEEEFKKEVESLYGKDVEVIGRYKGMSFPLVFKTKYGICQLKKASDLLKSKPSILCALNKTEYFMEMLKEKHPEIAKDLIPQSEYKTMKQKMLFKNKFDLVSISPDALMAGHCPNIRSAVNRKNYFKAQLEYLYEGKGYIFDMEESSTDRHKGRVKLICPVHGEQYVDSDGIFLGHGCPECNQGWTKSNIFYLVKLFNDDEEFYKLGISYIDNKGNIRRFREYKKLGYGVQELKIIKFEDFIKCRDFETKMKRLIKNSIYMPNKWPSNGTTECFKDEILPIILNKLKEQDIVSTSSESQSCQQAEKE